MSFASEVKNELARAMPEKPCCRLAELAGFIRIGGAVGLVGGGRLTLTLSTENPAVARHYKKLLRECFGTRASLFVGEHANFRKKGHLYELCMDDSADAEHILRETGIFLTRDGYGCIDAGICDEFLKTKCCRKAYLRGAFLGAGTLNDPEKGYHLEIVCGSETLAADVRRLFNSFTDIHAKVAFRRGRFAVYLKNAGAIADILNILGAHGQLLAFENIRIVKELRNRTNRINNCDNANLDKSLRAAEAQSRAIAGLCDGAGPDALPEKLRAAALLRLANPEASLAELGEMSDPPITKSSMHRRLKAAAAVAAKRGAGGTNERGSPLR
ncbi:MAG: DNA-binding protein WhiA [Clostridiales Family XIII bacterium]|jgi:DNA-binding protein WhiA|nr:DNA-binding protein WhiA [Clostridiales Family XIII bacterium]